MKITVLAKNSVCKSNTKNLKSENGLSLLIESDERKIIFDAGQSDFYIQNAKKFGIDLSSVDYLIISDGTFEYGGGLNSFLKINNKAKIFLHINAVHNFYNKIFGFIPRNAGFGQKQISQKNRIYFIDEDTQIEGNIILLEGFTEVIAPPEANEAIFGKEKYRFIADKSKHELVMLLIENDEIVLFSGCSHSGIINILEEVKLFSKTMRIKATFGEFHIHNSISRKNGSQDYFQYSAEIPGEKDPIFCSSQWRGENNFLSIKEFPGKKVQTMKTGQIFEI